MKKAMSVGVFIATLMAPLTALAEPLRILISSSHSRGAQGELPLLHATDDAKHVRDVLTSIGGFRPESTILLSDPTLAGLDAALERGRQLARGHVPEEVTFLFYFSGHGDRDRIHLGDTTLAMSDLSARVGTVPAGLRVIVTDACRNYRTRTKGVTTEPGFAITAPTTNAANGSIWLFASAEGEPAQESDELEGGLFTHYWLSALRGAGDTNGDGRVTVAESYDFAYSQTLLRSARGSGVFQHPAAVFDLKEAAPIVLTTTNDGATRLRFPRGANTRYLVYALGSHSVLGEVWGSADREVVLAVPHGRYVIQRRGGSAAGMALSLAKGEARALAAADFQAVPEEQLASKGGTIVLHPNEVSLRLGLGAQRLTTLEQNVGVRYSRLLGGGGEWALSTGATAALGSLRTSAQNVHINSLGASLHIERRFLADPWQIALTAGVEVDAFWQRLERTDAARVALAGYPTQRSFHAIVPGPALGARMRFAMSPDFWTEVEFAGATLFADLGGATGALFRARLAIGAGFAF